MTREDIIKIISDEVIKELNKINLPATSCCQTKGTTESKHDAAAKDSISLQTTNSSASTKIIIDKKVITEKSIESIIKNDIKELVIKKGSIVTPSAKDFLTNKKIKIIYS